MTPPLTPGFHHVSLVSGDADRTAAFYGGLLGLEPVGTATGPRDSGAPELRFSADAGRPGTLLAFRVRPGSAPGAWGVGGVHHVALGVPDETALLRWKRRLEDEGVRTTGPVDRGYFTSLYFSDPDGQVLELATAGPGYAIDEPADRLGERLVVPPGSRLPAAPGRAALARRTHPDPVPEIDDAMRVTGIHHVSGITDDLPRAHDFYAEALGLRLVKRTLNQDDGRTEHWFWARWDGGAVAPHSSFTLFGWPGSRRGARAGVGQTHHVAFRAADGDGQGVWQDHLRGLGVEVSEATGGALGPSIRFRAPDGLLLEIVAAGAGSDG